MLPRWVRGVLVVLAIMAGCWQSAHAQDAEGQVPTIANTASVLIMQVDDDARGFIFVSKTGLTAPVSYAACGESPSCQALLAAMLKANHATIVDISSGCKAPTVFQGAKF